MRRFSLLWAMPLMIMMPGLIQAQNIFPTSGNVGIGTTTPDSHLQVVGGNIKITNPQGYPFGFNIDMAAPGGWAREYSFTSNQTGKLFVLGAYGSGDSLQYGYIGGNLATNTTAYLSPWMVFLLSGNIGIGKTSPIRKLDIAGDGINLENTTHSSPNGIIFKNDNPFISNFNYGDNGTVATAGGNTFVGVNAGNLTMGSTAIAAIQASYNTAVGTAALSHNITGYHNTAHGYEALYYNDSGYNNTALGYGALLHNTTGLNNSASGYTTLYQNTTGNNNTASGFQALYYNTTGINNAATGYAALFRNTTGNNNMGDGYGALYSNTTGYSNTASGYAALYYNSTGDYNTTDGFQAGRYLANGSTPNTGSNMSVFVGANTKSLSTTDNNEVVIGYDAIGAGSNSVVLGNASITKTVLQGNVGIGTSTPQSKLAVNGEITAKKLRVITTGWPDYVFDPTYALPPLSRTEIYIQSEHHLPDIPSANDIKAGGLDIGEMQKKQMQKIEELTLYLIEMNKKMRTMEIQIKELKSAHDKLRD